MVLALKHLTLDCACGKVIGGKVIGYTDQYMQQGYKIADEGEGYCWLEQTGKASVRK